MSADSPHRPTVRQQPLWRTTVLLAAGLIAGLAAGCTNANSGLALPKVGGPIPVSLKREVSASERAFWDRLLQAQIIYIGETHNSNSDHEYQFDVLKGLKSRGVDYAIGWEMFETPQQALLDQWNARQITTDALLEKTDWRRHWGNQSVMYETMLRWSLPEGVPSIALNAPSSLSHKLAFSQPLTAEETAMLPTGFNPLPGGFEHFAEQMNTNPHAAAAARLENFYKAQTLWDQTMASRVVAFVEAHPDAKLVVLTGRGHLEGGFGVPAYVRQRSDARQLILFPGGAAPEPKRPGSSIAARRGSSRRLAYSTLSSDHASARSH